MDDIIRIARLEHNLFHVAYTYANIGVSSQQMTQDMLTAYLGSMFQLITADTRPFIAVQIDLPLMPSICLAPSQLSWNSSYIIEQVRIQFNKAEAEVPPGGEPNSLVE